MSGMVVGDRCKCRTMFIYSVTNDTVKKMKLEPEITRLNNNMNTIRIQVITTENRKGVLYNI